MAASRAFLDTTVVTDALLKSQEVAGISALRAIGRYDEALMPTYALKELQLGPMKNYHWAYRTLTETGSLAATLRSVHRVRGRANLMATALEAIAGAREAWERRGGEPVDDRAEAAFLASNIGYKLRKAWRQRESFAPNVEVTHPLPCLREAQVTGDGGLKFPSPPCKGRCALRAYLDADSLDAVATANSTMTARRETQRRGEALDYFKGEPGEEAEDRSACKSLGDATFAILAPNDAVILTTNDRDHGPLAAALDKTTVKP